MLHSINKITTALPKWDQAKTMDDVDLTAPSLYDITHPRCTAVTHTNTTSSSITQDDDEGNNNSIDDIITSPSTSLPSKQHEDKVKQAQDSLYDDIRDARLAIDLFLNSQINECLEIVTNKRSSMYHSLSYACLLAVTAILTYQREDIGKAIVAMKETYQLADKFRCRTWKQHLRGIAKGHTIQEIKNMTPLQRHAELVYAETYLMKSGLQILYDQSLVLAIREAIKAYSAHSIYKSLEAYMLHAQAEAGKGVDVMADYGLDEHLVSGIAFGMAGFNLALSAVPDFILRLVELVGFQGDRTLAFWYCTSVGGWDDKDKNKGIGNNETGSVKEDTNQHLRQQGPDEGLRRTFCDMILMGYNIVLSKMTHLSHVDQALGDRVLAYHLQHYPNGVIFLALKGRQLATHRQLDEAKVYYQRSMDAQDVWPQLQDVARWELGTLALIEQDWRCAHEMFRILLKQSRWSKCVYMYLYATSLYMVALDLNPPGLKRNALLENVAQTLKGVTKAKQKVAGRSIFIEKFFARKSRKYGLQGNRLLFPDLEILLSIGALELMPNHLIHKNLSRINTTLKRLETSRSLYVHDDIALSHLLRATLYRFLLEIEEQQEQQVTSSSPPTSPSSTRRHKILGHDELRRTHPFKMLHRQSIQTVMDHAPKIQLDHWIYYFAIYEKAQLLIIDEMYAEAKRELDNILRFTEKNDFNMGVGTRSKSKYSMENALILKCHSCLGYIAEVATKGSIVGQFACSASLSHRYRLHQQQPRYHGPSDGLDEHTLNSRPSPV